MLAAAPSLLPPRNPSPPLANTTKSVKSGGRLSPTISTKFRCGADLGRSTALGLDAQQQRGRAKQKPQEQEQQQLSGVDVLRALQRASAQKIKKNRKQGWERVAEKGNRVREGVDVAKAESTVRALCINGEWGARLDDLEKQLYQLMHS